MASNNKQISPRKIILSLFIITIIVIIAFLQSQKAGQGNDAEVRIQGVPLEDANSSSSTDTLEKTSILPLQPAPARLIEDPNLAPELRGLHGFINTNDTISLRGLAGKVVLIDFWTYSCINCIRTLPYITTWDSQYRDDGLVIIGVHTPEFAFEKELKNVQAAVNKHGIKYPVVLDNDYATWKAYGNHYWPRKYLIDAQGQIRYDHIGEGKYEQTEEWIRKLLLERDRSLQLREMADVMGAKSSSAVGTPEIYFGYHFTRGNFGNAGGLTSGTHTYTIPPVVAINYAYLEGKWEVTKDYSEILSDSGLVLLPYTAKAVNIVAGSKETITASVFIDESFVDESFLGLDLDEGKVRINEERLYNLIEAPVSGTHVILINATKGFRIYTFTFG